MRFFGAIAFLDSTREDRVTAVTNFEVISDWYQSVKDFFLQEVMSGDYDGTEITISVYEYRGHDGVITRFDYDSDRLVGHTTIRNPYSPI